MKSYAWLNVGGSWTRSLAVGDVILPYNTENATELDTVFLIIPGNPGIDEFYEHFSEELNSLTKIPVWTISHLNHVPIPPELSKECYTATSPADVVVLSDQITHKLDFIKEYVPKDVRIFLIGHSIGCLIILKILNELKDLSYNVQKAFLFFPTIQHMAETENGQTMLRLRRWYMDKVLLSLPYLVYWLPCGAKHFLIKYRIEVQTPDCVVRAAENLFHWNILKNALLLGYDELENVRELPEEILKQNKHLLVFYYGMDDGWCPWSYGKELKKKFPDMKILFCNQDCEHAFVISSGEIIAKKLAELTQSC